MPIVLDIITGLGGGGAERVLYNLITHSQANCFQHIVISLTDMGEYGEPLKGRGIEVHCLYLNKNPILGIYKSYKLIKLISPDIIQTWLYHADFLGLIIGKLAGIKNIIWNIRASVLPNNKGFYKTKFIRRLCSVLSSLPTAIIYCAESARKEHGRIGYKNKQEVVINNGYDLDKFKYCELTRREKRKKYNISEKDIVIGNIGRFDYTKNHELLLHAFAEVKKYISSFKLVIVGRGIDSNNAKLMEWIKEYALEDNILLLGHIPDVEHLYPMFDILVSSSRVEGFPNVIAEAMASQIPCIVTNAGDSAHIVGDIGIIVPIDSVTELSAAILNMLNQNKIELYQKGLCARNRVADNFSLTTMVIKYENLYQQIIDKNLIFEK
ncbi:glycosyltransferase family 4 protein [Aquella oligotrophica]|uniref:Glycosyl transferase family 1 n=1 Tax=Aquella oligotrophica TaxID=2067065 RepID=A0A2I7N9K0_9NEIS|nr:glycosyltransferase [Aquella oligotrophica]AUR53123.1 glycosyl transferase family 1 [Aquella oligotrophica]